MFNYQWWHWLYLCPSPIYFCLFIQTDICHTRLSFSKFIGWSSVWSWTWVSYDLFFDSLWSHFLLFFGQICRKRSCYQVIYLYHTQKFLGKNIYKSNFWSKTFTDGISVKLGSIFLPLFIVQLSKNNILIICMKQHQQMITW